MVAKPMIPAALKIFFISILFLVFTIHANGDGSVVDE